MMCGARTARVPLHSSCSGHKAGTCVPNNARVPGLWQRSVTDDATRRRRLRNGVKQSGLLQDNTSLMLRSFSQISLNCPIMQLCIGVVLR
jgi:hypothetical protein